MTKNGFLSRVVILAFSLPVFAPAEDEKTPLYNNTPVGYSSSEANPLLQVLVTSNKNSLHQVPEEVLGIIGQYLSKELNVRLVCEKWRQVYDKHVYKCWQACWKLSPISRDFFYKVSMNNYETGYLSDEELRICIPNLSINSDLPNDRKIEVSFCNNLSLISHGRGVIIRSIAPQTLGEFLERLDCVKIGHKKPLIKNGMIVCPKETLTDRGVKYYLYMFVGSILIFIVISAFPGMIENHSSELAGAGGCWILVFLMGWWVRGFYSECVPKNYYALR